MGHWVEIAYMAVVCLIQELRGQEPDCPACWKCEMMRVIVLSLAVSVAVKIVEALL